MLMMKFKSFPAGRLIARRSSSPVCVACGVCVLSISSLAVVETVERYGGRGQQSAYPCCEFVGLNDDDGLLTITSRVHDVTGVAHVGHWCFCTAACSARCRQPRQNTCEQALIMTGSAMGWSRQIKHASSRWPRFCAVLTLRSCFFRDLRRAFFFAAFDMPSSSSSFASIWDTKTTGAGAPTRAPR